MRCVECVKLQTFATNNNCTKKRQISIVRYLPLCLVSVGRACAHVVVIARDGGGKSGKNGKSVVCRGKSVYNTFVPYVGESCVLLEKLQVYFICLAYTSAFTVGCNYTKKNNRLNLLAKTR